MMMRVVSGHQPVYLPWLGLFHKLYLSDVFVYMDTVQYLEGDWNNRNKIRTPQGWAWLTVPIDRRASSGRMLDQIIVRGHEDPESKEFWQKKHWSTLLFNYRKAPYFACYSEALENMYCHKVWVRLIDICWHQFQLFSEWLGLSDRKVVRMSEVTFEGFKDELVLDHCKKLSGHAVVFGKNGKNYVRTNIFHAQEIDVYFQTYQHPSYTQRFSGFESYMSVLDLLMNHGPDESLRVLLQGNVSREQLKSGNLWEPRL